MSTDGWTDGRRWPLRGVTAAAAVGYAAGLIPSADLAARAATGGRVDLRQHGTGNPGGANATALLGRRWGYAVMAADIAKGALACRLGRRLAGDTGQHVAGVASVVGHCYPVTTRFRGGKGVGTSVGQCLATFPVYLPVDLGVAAAVASGPWQHRARAATAVASAAWVTASVVWWWRGWPNAWGGRPSVGLPIAAATTSALVLRRFAAGSGR